MTPGFPHEQLSAREQHVFIAIGCGKTPSEIAKELNISVRTVANTRAMVLARCGMKRTYDIIVYCAMNGLTGGLPE